MMFIILTAADADTVRSDSLIPVERAGDVFILNTTVLEDPTHAEHHNFLSAMPRLAYEDPQFPPPLEVIDL